MLCPNGTVKPFLVSLVEPVAYLKSELTRTGSANINTSDFQQSTSHSHFLRGKRHVMSTNKSRKKGTATTAARNGMTVASGVLRRLAPGEVASVLRIMLDRDTTLTRGAQSAGVGLVSLFP